MGKWGQEVVPWMCKPSVHCSEKIYAWIFFKMCTCMSEYLTKYVKREPIEKNSSSLVKSAQFVFHILMMDDAYPTPLSLVPDSWRTKRAIFFIINVYYLEVHLSGRIFARHRTICPEQKILTKKNLCGPTCLCSDLFTLCWWMKKIWSINWEIYFIPPTPHSSTPHEALIGCFGISEP